MQAKKWPLWMRFGRSGLRFGRPARDFIGLLHYRVVST